MALGNAVEAGMGVALLPCYLEQLHPGLVALSVPDPEIDISVWVLVHQDMQNAAPVRACLEHLARGLRSDSEQISGRPRKL